MYRYLDDKEIAQILHQLPAQKAAEQLVDTANQRGGEDNITALVVKVDQGLPVPIARKAVVAQTNSRVQFAESVQVESGLASRLQTLAPKIYSASEQSEQVSGSKLRPAIVSAPRFGNQVLMVAAAFLAGIGLTTYLHVAQLSDSDQARLSRDLVAASGQHTNSLEERSSINTMQASSQVGESPEQIVRNDYDGAPRARLSPGVLQQTVNRENDIVKSRQDLSIELSSAQIKIDTETRKLTTWFLRQRQVEAGMPSVLASEIAVSSPAVRQQKQSFDAANWDYLREAETLLYNPADEALEKKVKELSRVRETRLKELDDGIKLAVRSALDASLAHLFELTTQRDRLQAALRGARATKKSR